MNLSPIDPAKVTAALDNGWSFLLYKNALGSYTVIARHDNPEFEAKLHPDLFDEDGEIVTDDFTPEKALTRAAYKVVDQIILGATGTPHGDLPDLDLKEQPR